MEALAYESTVISYEEWGGLVRRHGTAIGQHLGTGINGIPDLSDALRMFLCNNDLRRSYGKAGRIYVEKEYNNKNFFHHSGKFIEK